MQIIVGRNPGIIKNPNLKKFYTPSELKKIGRTHCKLTYDDGVYHIENIKAINKTFIDNVPLRDGERKQVYLTNDINLGGVYSLDLNRVVSQFKVKEGPIGDTITLASWGARFGGIMLDTLFLILILIPIGYILQLLVLYAGYDFSLRAYTGTIDKSGGIVLFLAFLFYISSVLLVYHFYYVVQLHKKGRTLGKRLVGVKVVDAASHRYPTKTQAWGRLLAYFMSSLILYIGFLMPLWTKRKQGLHDLMANTIVIKDKS